MSQYFPPNRSSRSNIKVELNLSNYAKKSDLKNVTRVDVSCFALKTNLSSLKTEVDKLGIDELTPPEVDKLGIDELTPLPDDLAKLSNVVKDDLVKKTEYTKLVSKVNGTDTTNFVSTTKYENGGSDLEKNISDVNKKIPDVSTRINKKQILMLVEKS